MASLDISPEIGRHYQKLVSGPAPNKPSPYYAHWALFSVSAPLQNAFVQSSASKASTMKVQTAGGWLLYCRNPARRGIVLTIPIITEGELEELIEEFNDGRAQFAFVKIKDPNTGLPKFVLICWVCAHNCWRSRVLDSTDGRPIVVWRRCA